MGVSHPAAPAPWGWPEREFTGGGREEADEVTGLGQQWDEQKEAAI